MDPSLLTRVQRVTDYRVVLNTILRRKEFNALSNLVPTCNANKYLVEMSSALLRGLLKVILVFNNSILFNGKMLVF